MKEVTSHHDGYGLNELIKVRAGEIGPGGAPHLYVFIYETDSTGQEVGRIQFQCGPRGAEDSTPGVTAQAVLAAVIDHLDAFQKGQYPSRETALAITKLQEAMSWLRTRADDRARRGVLGTLQR
jgi:hypothetical protein